MKLAVLVVLVAWVGSAGAYGVGPAKPLAELAQEADLVCKATVIADAPIVDPSFEPVMGFEVHEASLRVISSIKGKPAAKDITFRYYADLPDSPHAGYAPQAYAFTIGRTYIVFARGAGTRYEQAARSHTMKEDQGVVLAADAKPHRGSRAVAAVRAELLALLKRKTTADVTYAIRQLDELSGGRMLDLEDLDRAATLAALRPMLLSASDEVAHAALDVFGADSPYFDEQQAPFWLAGMSKGTIAGIGGRTPPAQPSASAATKELLAVASKRPGLRALAIRALGRTRAIPAATLAGWARDTDPGVRSAAIAVSAELADHRALAAGAADPAPEVRRAAAFSIGFAQDAALVPLLGTLLSDASSKVQQAAAMSLLSFPVERAAVTMTAALSTDWAPLFVNALAKRDPAPYTARLADIIEHQRRPANWWGGTIPAGVSWDLLYGYVKAQPAADLAAGKHDRSLDALERMRWFSSSQPRDLYAFYVVRKLDARAKRFRAAARLSTAGDLESYFAEAQQHPERFSP